MKKLFFIAAIAGAALVSCTKNELAPSVTEQQEITFTAPVIGTLTKAPVPGEIGAGSYSTDEEFNVYAVYHEGEYVSATSTKKYMDNVPVAYGSPTKNYWAPEHVTDGVAYYWPKNTDGMLTFAAYSPSETSGTVGWTAASGFTLSNFVVESSTADQYDLMFSKRTMNKTSSIGGTSYDGVDINFEHALSSIVFKAQREGEYVGMTIKLYSITILDVYNKGNYTQGLVDDNSNDCQSGYPKWEVATDAVETDYVVFNSTDGVSINAETMSTPLTAINNPVILLPQLFKHTLNEVSVQIDYSIKTATGDEVPQQKIISLETGNGGGQFKDGTNNIDGWKIGKRYTYTIVFGLETIYFSPEVETDWDDVTVTGSGLDL